MNEIDRVRKALAALTTCPTAVKIVGDEIRVKLTKGPPVERQAYAPGTFPGRRQARRRRARLFAIPLDGLPKGGALQNKLRPLVREALA